ncbi:MAG: creatininase family protein [SAR324 cluster bacterium]|nr:creatininase family protein [SAR324 cluster bacterium]
MRLQLSTWQEVDSYLKQNTGVIVPIGSTEQHGPNGLIGTDAVTSEKIAQLISEQHDVLIAPTISIGMAQHHMAFSGSISLKPSTFIAMICDIVTCLTSHGFTHICFVNGHGGNVAPLKVAFSELYSEYSFSKRTCPFKCEVTNWYAGKRIHQLSKELYGSSEGSHATPSEVSLSYYIYPESVKEAVMTPKLAPEGVIRDALDYRKQFPDGRIGSDPSLASIEDGEKICAAAAVDVYEAYQAFLKE